jgi:hypothetical protein
MKAVAWAVVDEEGEVVVCRTSKVAASEIVRDFYPGCRVVPLSFIPEESEGDNQ